MHMGNFAAISFSCVVLWSGNRVSLNAVNAPRIWITALTLESPQSNPETALVADVVGQRRLRPGIVEALQGAPELISECRGVWQFLAEQLPDA